MGPFYYISRRHDILVIVLSNKFALPDVFYVLPLVFGLRNKNNAPSAIVILDFNNTTISA